MADRAGLLEASAAAGLVYSALLATAAYAAGSPVLALTAAGLVASSTLATTPGMGLGVATLYASYALLATAAPVAGGAPLAGPGLAVAAALAAYAALAGYRASYALAGFLAAPFTALLEPPAGPVASALAGLVASLAPLAVRGPRHRFLYTAATASTAAAALAGLSLYYALGLLAASTVYAYSIGGQKGWSRCPFRVEHSLAAAGPVLAVASAGLALSSSLTGAPEPGVALLVGVVAVYSLVAGLLAPRAAGGLEDAAELPAVHRHSGAVDEAGCGAG